MEPGHILVRALFAYLFLLVLVRLSGQRSIAQGTAFDFVLALVLGDMVDDLLFAEVSAATFVAATGTLALVHLLAADLSRRSPALSHLVSGSPTVLLQDGVPNLRNLRRERLNEDDLEALLRRQGVAREAWGDVACARLESEGELSVILRRPRRELQEGDLR